MCESGALFFSIVIPSYNRGKFIGETISSLINQTFRDFEIIIIDDGSTDDTREVITQLHQKDVRVKYFYKENGERGAARNYGIDKAKGKYITFIDSDDIAYPFAFETAFTQLQLLNCPSCFVVSHEIRFKENGDTIGRVNTVANINQEILKGNLLSCIGVFLKSEVLRQYRFDEDRKFSGSEDWLLWLKIAAKYNYFHHDRICYCMYQHHDRSVMNYREEDLIYRAKHLRTKLYEDELFLKTYGEKSIIRIYAHMLTYASLHLAMSGKKTAAIRYWINALFTGTSEIFSRRTLGILKNLITN